MSTVTINTVPTTTMLPDQPAETILRLSENIAEKTRSLTASLKSRGLPLPSSDAVGPSEFALSKMGNDDLKLREELIAQTKELHDLLVGPSEGMKALAKDVSFVQKLLETDANQHMVGFWACLCPSNLQPRGRRMCPPRNMHFLRGACAASFTAHWQQASGPRPA